MWPQAVIVAVLLPKDHLSPWSKARMENVLHTGFGEQLLLHVYSVRPFLRPLCPHQQQLGVKEAGQDRDSVSAAEWSCVRGKSYWYFVQSTLWLPVISSLACKVWGGSFCCCWYFLHRVWHSKNWKWDGIPKVSSFFEKQGVMCWRGSVSLWLS